MISYSQNVSFQKTKDSLENKKCKVFSLKENIAIFRTSQNKFGAIDNLGKIVVKPELEMLHNFENDLAVFKADKKFGIKKIDGTNLIEPKNKFIFKANDNLFAVLKDNKYGLIDNMGSLIFPYEYVFYGKTDELIFASKEDKYGYIKLSDLKFYDTPEFDEIISPDTNLFDLRCSLIVRKDNKFGLIDENSKIIIPIIYDEIYGSLFSIVAVKKDGKFGIIDKNNTVLKPIVYDGIQSIKAGFILIDKNNKEKYFDQKML